MLPPRETKIHFHYNIIIIMAMMMTMPTIGKLMMMMMMMMMMMKYHSMINHTGHENEENYHKDDKYSNFPVFE